MQWLQSSHKRLQGYLFVGKGCKKEWRSLCGFVLQGMPSGSSVALKLRKTGIFLVVFSLNNFDEIFTKVSDPEPCDAGKVVPVRQEQRPAAVPLKPELVQYFSGILAPRRALLELLPQPSDGLSAAKYSGLV